MSTMTGPTLARRTVECPHCGHAVAAVARQTAFCPHCGRPLRRFHRFRRAAYTVIVALIVVGATVILRSMQMKAPDSGTAAVRAVADPTDVVLADALAARIARAADLDGRADQVRTVRQALVDQVADLSNLSARVSTALARATDEDRWPAKVAGRSLTEDDARDLLARVAATVAAERKAADRDADVLAGITAAAGAVRAESADVAGLRHDLAADPPADRRADIVRRADAYRAAAAPLPNAAGLTADPTRPVDVDALMH